MDNEAQRKLMDFYRTTSEVSYVEHATRMEQKYGNLLLRLVPVGLERLPTTVEEVKVGGGQLT